MTRMWWMRVWGFSKRKTFSINKVDEQWADIDTLPVAHRTVNWYWAKSQYQDHPLVQINMRLDVPGEFRVCRLQKLQVWRGLLAPVLADCHLSVITSYSMFFLIILSAINQLAIISATRAMAFKLTPNIPLPFSFLSAVITICHGQKPDTARTRKHVCLLKAPWLPIPP